MESPWLVIYGAALGAVIFVAGALPAAWSENAERRRAAAKFLSPFLMFRRSITQRGVPLFTAAKSRPDMHRHQARQPALRALEPPQPQRMPSGILAPAG